MIIKDITKYINETFFLLVSGVVFLSLALLQNNEINIFVLFLLFGAILTFHFFHLAVFDEHGPVMISLLCLIITYLALCLIFRTWVSILILPFLLNIHIIKNIQRPIEKFVLILTPNILFVMVMALEFVINKPQSLDIWHSWLGLIFLTFVSVVCIALNYIINLAATESENMRESIKAISVNELREHAVNRELIIKQYLLERNVRLEERERISLNIHNAVGHTITSGILAMDAAEALFGVNPDKAMEKLAVARECVHQGLDIVRQAIRMIDSDDENIAGSDVVSALITHIEHFSSVTGLSVNHNMRDFNSDTVLPRIHAEFLTNTLLELLSNGSKHSDAALYMVMFNLDESRIRLAVSDNGRVFSEIPEKERLERLKNGYGLRKIEKYVLRFGGNFKLTYTEGFTVDLTIPIIKERGDA